MLIDESRFQSIDSLCSKNCAVVTLLGEVNIWIGRGSTALEQRATLDFAKSVSVSLSSRILELEPTCDVYRAIVELRRMKKGKKARISGRYSMVIERNTRTLIIGSTDLPPSLLIPFLHSTPSTLPLTQRSIQLRRSLGNLSTYCERRWNGYY